MKTPKPLFAFRKSFFWILILLTLISSVQLKSTQNEEIWTSQTSFNEIIEKAKKGSAYYQGLLGIFLRSGEAGCAVNYKLSGEWSRISWQKGHPFGAFNLANLAILEGNFEKANELFQDSALLMQRKASDGDPVAMHCMGEIDFTVMPTNPRRAMNFFQKSSDLGYPPAQATIGTLSLQGLPGLYKKDYNKGISLLSQAVTKKSLAARYNLGMAYFNGDGVTKDLKKASQWLEVAVRQNFDQAQYHLGLMLVDGNGIPKNTNRGLSLLSLAAEQGHQLAKIYLEKRNGSKATLPSTNSIEKNNATPFPLSDADALQRARKYYTGVGVEKDYNKAYQLFLPLAHGGNPEASRFVGLMNLTGKGTIKNLNTAKQWLSVAAQKGDSMAIRLLNEYKLLFK